MGGIEGREGEREPKQGRDCILCGGSEIAAPGIRNEQLLETSFDFIFSHLKFNSDENGTFVRLSQLI